MNRLSIDRHLTEVPNQVSGSIRSTHKLSKLRPHYSIEPHYDEGKHLYWKPLCIAGRTKAKHLGLKALPYPKPNAARPVDEHGTPECEAGETPAGRSTSPAPATQEAML